MYQVELLQTNLNIFSKVNYLVLTTHLHRALSFGFLVETVPMDPPNKRVIRKVDACSW